MHVLEIYIKKQLQYIDDAIEKLNNIHKNYLPKSEHKQEQNHKNKPQHSKEKSFVGYLQNDNKDALMAKLHELFDNAKGKK